MALVALACSRGSHPEPPRGAAEEPKPAAVAAATFVGAARCAPCHADQAARWRASHHALAMQAASPSTVLGRFDGAPVSLGGVEARFFERDGRPFVHTRGADGAPADFEIAYTFGVAPLQQYLLPAAGGRMQALDLAWDARPAAVGGQRWFDLHAGAPPPPGDPLHWTGVYQSWNLMCAECHSTNLVKGYDAAADRYQTTWSEVDVSCEACHGPGSRHVEWAERGGGDPDRGLPVRFPGRGSWSFAPGEPIARRAPEPAPSDAELDACGRCHARRGAIRSEYEYGRPLLDTHRPALLDEGLYRADGQIDGEVYEWGSFLQSRMHTKGVTCTDCHDPHSLRIDVPDQACARCHRPEVFATTAHHHHPAGSAGASCVACHMPTRTYMGVDARRDHSLRVPRPDLSVELGTPNACNACHADRSPRWASDTVKRWYPQGRSGTPHYGEAIDAGRRGLAEAPAALAALVADRERPAIARATALALLGGLGGSQLEASVRLGAQDPDALLRMAAAGAAAALDPATRVALAAPLLRDPVRAVRIDAANALLDVAPELWPPGGRAALAEALGEFREAQLANADRPEGQLGLGALHARLGEPEDARRAYERALRLDPGFTPAAVDLADLLRETGSEAEAERVLREALARAPEAAELHYALGLSLVRQGRREDALEELQRAAERAPETARYAYAYALLLHELGRSQSALAVLAKAHERRPGERDVLIAMTTMSRDTGDRAGALRWAQALVALDPTEPQARALLAELEQAR